MKKGKAILMLVMVISVFMSSLYFSFESCAANYEFVSEHNEPTVGDYSGYVNLAVSGHYSTGTDLATLVWYIVPETSVGYTTSGIQVLPTCSVSIYVSQNEVSLSFENNSCDRFNIFIYEMQSNGYICLLHSGTYDGSIFGHTATWKTGSFISGASFKGNVSGIKYNGSNYVPSVSVTWNKEAENLTKLNDIVSAIYTLNTSLGGKLDSLITKINTLITEVDNLEELLVSVEECVWTYLPGIWEETVSIQDDTTRIIEILEMLEYAICADDTNQGAMDEFGSSSSAQSDKINGLNEQNKTDKADVGSSSDAVDDYIDTEAIGDYGVLLSVFTGNSHILRMILIVLAVATISYVLFGKK